MARLERSTPSFVIRHATRGGLIALAAWLAGCASLLGIEELSPDPDPAKGGAGQAGSATGATGGKAGSTGTGGTAGAAGGRAGASGSSGAAGAAARAGSSSGGSSGNGVGGNSGAGGSTGGSAGSGGTVAGSGGEGGVPPVEGGTVTGNVIDFWRHPIPNVPVRIGDETVITDATGKFVIEDVAATYDAACVITLANPAKVYEWVYLGLSRRDPTLQVTEAFNSYEAIFSVSQVNGGTFGDDLWMVGFGSENGSDSDTADSAGFYRRPDWWGPSVNEWTLHSIFLERTGELPSKYVAYETQTATTNASGTTMEQAFEMDLTQQVFDTGNVTGAIVEDTGVGRTNSVFVRFTSGGNVPLVDRVATSASSYQYLVPTLANGSITIAAAETHDDDSYTIAHRDGRNVGDTGVDIVIPSPVTGLAPLDETMGVDSDTAFSFAAGDPDNSGYVVHIESEEYQQGVYIVTANRQFTLGDVPVVTNNLIVPNGWHNWTVQTHGQFDSVDEMTGPNGYLDAFATSYYRPQGPQRESGAFTVSYQADFQAEP